ncbi:MAG: Hint domain-containing protein [Paracoccaceae bacterium]|nr:Hint domain-containing protein [Paracoccaceae bacterium]
MVDPKLIGLNSLESCALLCVVNGTSVATKRGSVPVEELCLGDNVLTRDSGFQPIVWIGARRIKTVDERPLVIPSGSYRDVCAERDLLLSPHHRILRYEGAKSVYTHLEEVLVQAKDVGIAAPVRSALVGAWYFHVLFESHQIILANGVWIESLMPTQHMIDGLCARNRASMMQQLPALATKEGWRYDPVRAFAC